MKKVERFNINDGRAMPTFVAPRWIPRVGNQPVFKHLKYHYSNITNTVPVWFVILNSPAQDSDGVPSKSLKTRPLVHTCYQQTSVVME